jgi:hypothetical protein
MHQSSREAKQRIAFRFASPMVVVAVIAHLAQAQTDSAFTDLRRDGNGFAPLTARISTGFTDLPAGVALRTIATTARVDLTFDPTLTGITAKTSMPPHQRTVAVAILEITQPLHLRARVASSGQIIVVAETPTTPAVKVASADTTRAPVSLPAVRTDALRTERQTFETQTNVGGLAITGRELRASPTFVEPDLMRSVQLLPGIEARSDYSAGFNVRGGEADQSLVLIDGYPIYNPYHLGGLFSTFIDATVGNVELHKGVLPARYGGRLSGVLDVQSAEPTSDEKHGTAEVSLISSNASIGETFANGAGSWTVAARRTYADLMVNLLTPYSFPYHFQDVQGHLTRAFTDGLRLSITAYDGLDAAAGSGGDAVGANWGNSVVGATLSKRFDQHFHIAGLSFGDSVVAEQRVSFTHFGSNSDVTEILFHARNSLSELRAGGSFTSYRGSTARTLGYEVARQSIDYAANSVVQQWEDFIPFDSVRQRSNWASLYANQVWRPWESLLADVGLLLETVPTARWTGLSPRVSLKYFLGRTTAITAGAGSYAQWMHSLGREEEPVEPLQFWIASSPQAPVSRANDAAMGLERWVTPTRLLHVEAFYKKYERLLVPNINNDSRVTGDELSSIDGYSYGVDFLLRQLDGGPFSGWLAYSYAINSRIGADGVGYWPTQDRRHNLNLVGSWHSALVTLGARANIGTGAPYTPINGGFRRSQYDPVTQKWISSGAYEDDELIPGAFNSQRLPWYTRVDVSVNRRGHLFGVPMDPYLSIVNVFNAHNPAAYHYSFYGRPERSTFPNLPFAPTFGVNIAY